MSAQTIKTCRTVFVDWGSSSFRAFLCKTDSGCNQFELEAKTECNQGVLSSNQDQLGQILLEQIQTLFQQAKIVPELYHNENNPIQVICSGMIGSQFGFHPVPYLDSEKIDSINNQTFAINAFTYHSLEASEHFNKNLINVFIIPGLQGKDFNGFPDVMRGEEVQLLGAIAHLEMEASKEGQISSYSQVTVVVPGTHSKWITLEFENSGYKIKGFETYLTGELFQWVAKSSSIAPALSSLQLDSDQFCSTEFADGLDHATQSGHLLHQLFSLRSISLVDSPLSMDYLSGLLIGHELKAGLENVEPNNKSKLIVIGNKNLNPRYEFALSHLQKDSVSLEILDSNYAFLEGMKKISQGLNVRNELATQSNKLKPFQAQNNPIKEQASV